jgi:hypothetical protein
MACEFCSPGDDECGVCREWDEFDRRRSYSRAVSVVCLVVMVLITVTAGICAAVNTFGGKH